MYEYELQNAIREAVDKVVYQFDHPPISLEKGIKPKRPDRKCFVRDLESIIPDVGEKVPLHSIVPVVYLRNKRIREDIVRATLPHSERVRLLVVYPGKNYAGDLINYVDSIKEYIEKHLAVYYKTEDLSPIVECLKKWHKKLWLTWEENWAYLAAILLLIGSFWFAWWVLAQMF